MQAQLRGETPLTEAPAAPLAADDQKKIMTAREIAAAHVAQGMVWLDPWVKRGERIDQVRQMCAAGLRSQLLEVAQQEKQALLTGLRNLREQIETSDNMEEKEALSFFLDFTNEAIKRT